jgi:uncharacterized cupredoxin-like copper-binding protein
MTRTFKALVALALLLFLVFVIAGTTPASAEPQTVHVTLKDYAVSLSQFVVTSDRAVRFVVDNQSSLPHRLAMQPMSNVAGSNSDDEPVIAPGTIRTLQHTFSPGVYRIVCLTTDHAGKGMLTVFAAEPVRPSASPIRMDFAIPFLVFVLGSVWILADSAGLRLIRTKD